VYIKGLEKDMKLWGAASLSIVQMLEGKTISALLAKVEDENPVHYRRHQLSVDPALATSWLDALAYAPGAQSYNVPLEWEGRHAHAEETVRRELEAPSGVPGCPEREVG
jgi:hypothetical protein